MGHSDETSPHRLFAAIVLMGTGLAVGCGGLAQGERQVGASGGPSGTSGSGATAGGPASGGSGGTVSSSPSGGAPVITIETGGVDPGPQPVAPGPFSCPPQQWHCAQQTCSGSRNGWALQDGCDCDHNRPLQASDCLAGQAFVCLHATSTADGRPLTEPVLMSCACTPKVDNCSDECEAAYGMRYLQCAGSDELSAECGCAIVFLK